MHQQSAAIPVAHDRFCPSARQTTTTLVLDQARSVLAWQLLTTGRVMLELSGRLAGRECPLGHLATQTARALGRLQREDAG